MSAFDKYKLQNIQYLLNVTLNSEYICDVDRVKPINRVKNEPH